LDKNKSFGDELSFLNQNAVNQNKKRLDEEVNKSLELKERLFSYQTSIVYLKSLYEISKAENEDLKSFIESKKKLISEYVDSKIFHNF
jgi:hypothetical protein